ncbi:M56 family metallopeptidase [Candidatus Daviesbacteria bacterium]|nr:M56 family metallopeptidase [Candidatus Daviesbacteria bacterium]
MGANRAFYILLASLSVALAGLITILYKSLPLTIAQAVYICQRTFVSTIILPHSIPFTLSLIPMSVLLVGLLTLGIQILKTRLYIKRKLGKKVFLPERVKKVASELDLSDKTDIIQDVNKFSFCYGIIRPRICLSTGFIKTLNNEELKAVLLHESYHLGNYDPLKIVIGKAAARMLFFIPALKDLQKYYAFSKEIAADGLAIKNSGKQPLISALSKLITLNKPKFSGVAALASLDDLEMRIKYLTSPQAQVLFRPSIFNISISIAAILFTIIILNAPVHAMEMDQQSIGGSYFICPYDDRCSKDCQINFRSKDINYSENERNSSTNRLYTPLEGRK